ncbi:MAG: hypothetical protein AAGJ79_08955 [Verrucomicrobiota bacterium]
MRHTLKSVITLGAAVAIAAPATAQDLEEVELEFPKPMFVGTPVAAKRPNLEKPDPTKVIKKISVPKGTTNVAAGKDVTSSDDFPIIGELEMVTDGDKDGADGSFVELGPEKQWVQIDLGAESTIHYVVLWHFHKNARAYDDVIVQISNDPEFGDGVETIFNNDHDDSSGLGKGDDPAYIETNHGRVLAAGGKKGQYVRLYSAGNTANELNHYIEVEVWGQ